MNGTIEWLGTIVLVLGLMGFDFFAQMRSPREPSFRQAIRWTVFYVALALAFGASMIWWKDAHSAASFVAGYVTEWSLSVDNLFVFLIILTRFAVPKSYRQRVLLFGVALALVLRGIFIAFGAAALSTFSWVFYLFGIFLVWTAVSVARSGVEEEAEYRENWIMRQISKALPSTKRYHHGALVVRQGGRRLVTPLLLVMLAIGTTDVLFAFDSIPAIFGLTTDPYIVFATNAFALMGLRKLFFVVHGLLKRMIYLSWGLAVILAFIGVKLVLHALHENALGFINAGRPVLSAPEVTIELSLGVIVGTLLVTGIVSWFGSRRAAAGPGSGDAGAGE